MCCYLYVFVYMRMASSPLCSAWLHVRLQVRHVAANPLQRSSLAAALDVRAFRCAVVLCDELWVDPDNNDANGLDSLDEPSVLRLDSLVMVAQVRGSAASSCCSRGSHWRLHWCSSMCGLLQCCLVPCSIERASTLEGTADAVQQAYVHHARIIRRRVKSTDLSCMACNRTLLSCVFSAQCAQAA